MTSTELATQVEHSLGASFWLKQALRDLSHRDVLDALNDAEALLAFARLRAQEMGLPADETR